MPSRPAARTTRLIGLLLAAIGLSTAVVTVGVAIERPVADAARTWFVAPWGDDDATGSASRPLETIGWAVRRARSGDTIVLRTGTYHEQVRVYGKRLAIRAQPGERAILDGAVRVEGWRSSGGDWYADGWTRQFYSERPGASVAANHRVAGYPDQMFVDGRPLRQVLSRETVVPGTFFHDTDADRLWIGTDPTSRRVEASDLRWAFHFLRAHGSSLTDVTVRRYATEERHMGAIRAHSNDLVIERVTAELNARVGISAIGSRIVVRDSRFVDNGHIGIHADRASTLVIERAAVIGNNKAGFDPMHSAAGVKVTSSVGVTVRDSDVSRNNGPGIWTDLDTDSVTLVRNLVERNGRAGIEVELSSNVNVLGNVALDNGEAGIWILESRNVQVLHNASYDNKNAIEVEEGPRREVANVRVHNNVLARGKASSRALLDVNDWTRERSATQMGVSIGSNAFWIPTTSGTRNLSRWAQWPQRPAYAHDLESHRSTTGQAAGTLVSTSGANPFVRSTATLDYRMPPDAATGSVVVAGAAAELGVASGSRPPIGPLSVVVRR